MSKILITGAATGFGRLTVEALIAGGHEVVGSMRDIRGRNRTAAAEVSALGAQVVEIDVTDDASTEHGVAEAIDRLGGLDGLVNNAGLGALGLAEAYTSDDWKRVFDINVFGVQRMNRAALPHMKARGQGLLITISSLTARTALPFQGPYGSSKWAVEALAESYRVECSQLGIESCIIEPGGMPTVFIDRLTQPSDPDRAASYGPIADMPGGFLKSFQDVFAANPEQAPHLVAEAIVRLVDTPHGTRPFRTIVDQMVLGEKVRPYNAHFETMTAEIYASFGISSLLEVKTA